MAEASFGTWVLIVILTLIVGTLGICLVAQLIVACSKWDGEC
jgi:hypothetical protein